MVEIWMQTGGDDDPDLEITEICAYDLHNEIVSQGRSLRGFLARAVARKATLTGEIIWQRDANNFHTGQKTLEISAEFEDGKKVKVKINGSDEMKLITSLKEILDSTGSEDIVMIR